MPNPPPHRPLIARHVVSLLPWSAAALAYAITPAVFGGGDGTAANPFRIGSPQLLENLRDALGTANEACVTGVHHYRQTRSLDLSDRADWTRGIGYGIEGLDDFYGPYRPFRGHYDGGGFTIAHFTLLQPFGYVEPPVNHLLGLFGSADAATIEDVVLTDANVEGRRFLGLLLGYGRGVTIRDVTVAGIITSSDPSGTYETVIGLLAGELVADSVVSDVASSGTVTGSRMLGGLIGRLNDGHVERSSSTATVTGNDTDIGGLIGRAVAGTLQSSYAIGVVTPGSGSSQVGGLVGSFGATIGALPSFWDADTTTQSTSAAGTTLSAAQARTFANLDDAGWAIVTDADPDDYHPTDLVWVLCDAPNPAEGGPKLAWQEGRSLCRPSLELAIVDGRDVLQNAPFAITLTLRDPQGNPFTLDAAITVTLTGAGGSVSGELLRDGGSVTATIPRGTSAVTVRDVVYTGAGANVTLTATSDGIAGGEASTTIAVGAAAFTVVGDTANLPAGGTGLARFVASLRDAQGAPVPGVPITVTTTRGSIQDTKGRDRGNRTVDTTNLQGDVIVDVRAPATRSSASPAQAHAVWRSPSASTTTPRHARSPSPPATAASASRSRRPKA